MHLGIVSFAITSSFALGSISPSFLGINNGAVEVRQFSLTDLRLQTLTTNQHAGAFRYPTGTGSGYWNWREGCVSSDKSCGKVNNTVAALAAYVFATGVEPIIAVNMLTDTLTSQLAFLDAVAALGVPVTRVELGNEYYLQNPDYLKAFPTSADYGKIASTWITAIKAAHPGVAIAVVAAPVKPGTPSPREASWNSGLFSTLTGADAVTMHEYTDTQIGHPAKFTEADVPVLLGAPFFWVGAIAKQTSTLPTGLSVWVTEYNLKDAQVTGVCGTWAHGLYLAAEAALLTNGSTRVDLVIPWEFLGDASMGSAFATTDGFNFVGSPDPTLLTSVYGRTASGFTLGALASASHGHDSAVALDFSFNPTAHGANGLVYGTIMGVLFSGGGLSPSAFLLNLGPTANYSLSALSVGNFTHFSTLSAPPTAAVNADSVVTSVQGALNATLWLPPYSLTVLSTDRE